MCPVGFQGAHCNISCPTGCLKSEGCNQLTGRCNECIENRWGDECSHICSDTCENPESCYRNGTCHSCKVGNWGPKCEESCSGGCKSSCVQQTGHCVQCLANKWGNKCKQSCPNLCFPERICKKNSGNCFGCQKGWYGDWCRLKCNDNCLSCTGRDLCVDCKPGYFGRVCEDDCVPNCFNHTCNISTGGVLVVKKDILENIVISIVLHVSMTSANRNPVNV